MNDRKAARRGRQLMAETAISQRFQIAVVGASAHMPSFGRFQNADGFATELTRYRWRRSARRPASGVGLVLAAVAFALDHDGLDVVQ